MCLLLDTAHKTDKVINICGKLIFDYNLEFCITTHKSLKKFYIFSGKDTYDITFVGVMHAIGAVPLIVVQR